MLKKILYLKKIRLNFSSLGVILFLLFALTVDLRRYIYFDSIVAYASLIVAILLVFYYNRPYNRSDFLSMTQLQRIWLILPVFVVINNLRLFNPSDNYFVQLSVCVVLLFITRKSNDYYYHVISFLKIIGLVYAMTTIVFSLFPDFYLNNIIPLFADYQIKDLISLFKRGYLSGLTGHYSTNGIYLAVTFGCSVTSYLMKRSKTNAIITFVIFVALLMTGKRAHSIFSIVSVVAVIWWVNRDSISIAAILKAVRMVLLFIVVLVILSNFLPGVFNVINRFAETISRGDLSSSRIKLITKSLEHFWKNPLFGIGWGNITSVMNRYTHNVYVQLLTEVGIIGAFLFYYAFFIAFNKVRKLIIDKDLMQCLNTEEKSFILFAGFIQVFFILYCLTGNPLYDEQFLYPYFLSLFVINYFDFHKERILSNET